MCADNTLYRGDGRSDGDVGNHALFDQQNEEGTLPGMQLSVQSQLSLQLQLSVQCWSVQCYLIMTEPTAITLCICFEL